MKVLMLCPRISGSSFITSYSYSKMLGDDYNVTFVGPTFGEKPYVTEKGLKLELLEPKISKSPQTGMMELIPINFRRLLKQDYDVIHSFKLLPHTTPVAILAKKCTKKKVALTIEDYDAQGPRNPIKRSILKLAEKSYKFVDAVTTLSTGLQKIYGGEVINLTANEEIFNPEKHDGRKARKKYGLEENFVIGHIGNCYEPKGIHILVEAVKRIGNENIKLLISNIGDPDYIKKLKELAGNETVFHERVPLHEVPELVAACDVYVVPTLSTPYTDVENPTKMYEAMAMKKPVVGTNVSDIPLILDQGRAGALVKQGSVQALMEGIQKYVDSPRLRKKMSIRGYERYRKAYSFKAMSEKLRNVYSIMLSS